MTAAPRVLAALRAALEPAGLNLVGVAELAAYDAQVVPARRSQAQCPESRAIIVVGNGGPALWHAFLADLERAPDHLTRERHPLEAFVAREIGRADSVLDGIARRWAFAASEAGVVDLRVLGYLAGLGANSRLRLLMNALHGPWVGLRAACFLALDLPADAAGGPDLCEGCPAPCVSACPGDAFPEGHWNVDRCSDYHLASDRCSTRCHARLACPRGEASRYPIEQLHYHSNSHTGRAWLRAHLGIAESDDHYPGEPPLWGVWRSKSQ
jgi:epoxyqueuosine reductase